MVRTFGRSDSISFCRDAGFRVQLRFCVGSAGKPAAGPSGFFAREGNIVFRGWPDCGVCVGSIRPRSRCSGFAITVRGVCGRGIAAVSDAVYSRAAIRSGCNRRFYPCTNTKIARSAVLLRRALAGEAGFGVWSCRAGDAMRMIPGFRTSGLSERCRSGKRRMKPGKFCKSRRIC